MHPLEIIYEKARKNKKTIILPEGNDKRVIHAVSQIANLNLARPILLGEPDKVLKQARQIGENINLNKIEIINFQKDSKREGFIDKYYKMFQKKIDKDEAAKSLNNSLIFGAMLVANGDGDAMVAGADNTTADVFRISFQIIGPAEGITTISSYFLMIVPNCPYGEEGAFLFADAGIIPNPSPIQLANIAIACAKNFSSLLNHESKVAMLSFSTKSSAEHRMVEKVQKATEIVRKKKPGLIIDGELQVDTAIVPEVAARKAPGSPVGGRANVLIFPELDAGNIGYKLVERLAKAEAYGPVLQGLSKPVSDLSRGCSVRDIISCSAIVAASA